jgi:deoxyribodipyrimidine photo-lyase
VLRREGWTLSRLAKTVAGAKTGWWGASAGAEAYLDQLVTWRELGLNMSARRPDYDQFESLPPWAIRTLEQHATDPRPYCYSLDAFTGAATHDAVWNAAQRQLVTEGRIHNYLRMLWGKKILEWTRSPREALDVMIELNNRFAVDGRDPNSYTGIFWVLGRYDRPWFERPIFGSVRYMTSESTVRKLHLKGYLARFGQR